MRATARLMTTLLFLAATTAPAAVRDTGPNGFTVRHEVTVKAAPAAAYDALLAVGSWWDPAHTYSKDATSLSLDPRAGGCFCERLKDGGSVEHLRVVFLRPRSALRMTGGLGPLQGSGLAGSLTVTLKSVEEGTKLELTYDVGGHMEGGLEKIAPAVDGMLGGQVERLRSFIETGRPARPEAKEGKAGDAPR